MAHKSPLERLDDLARLTGIPQLNDKPPRRRPLRWPATVALAMAAGGFVLTLVLDRRQHWLGFAVLMVGFCVANFMPIFGPLKAWGARERVDEYDRTLRARAYLVAFSALTAVAVLSLWLLVWLSFDTGWTLDRLRFAIRDLAFLLAATYSAGPTCYASWAQRPLGED